MSVFSNAFSEDFFRDYMPLLSDLSLHPDFFIKLDKDDDWSFIIKLHSLMEVAFSYLLIVHFGAELESVFKALDMGNRKYGKAVFVRKLKLLEDNQLNFVDLLTEIRNDFAHDIRTINTGIKGYFTKIEDCKKDRYDHWCKILRLSEHQDNKKIKEHMMVLSMDILAAVYYKKIDTHATKAMNKDLIKMGIEKLAGDNDDHA